MGIGDKSSSSDKKYGEGKNVPRDSRKGSRSPSPGCSPNPPSFDFASSQRLWSDNGGRTTAERRKRDFQGNSPRSTSMELNIASQDPSYELPDLRQIRQTRQPFPKGQLYSLELQRIQDGFSRRLNEDERNTSDQYHSLTPETATLSQPDSYGESASTAAEIRRGVKTIQLQDVTGKELVIEVDPSNMLTTDKHRQGLHETLRAYQKVIDEQKGALEKLLASKQSLDHGSLQGFQQTIAGFSSAVEFYTKDRQAVATWIKEKLSTKKNEILQKIREADEGLETVEANLQFIKQRAKEEVSTIWRGNQKGLEAGMESILQRNYGKELKNLVESKEQHKKSKVQYEEQLKHFAQKVDEKFSQTLKHCLDEQAKWDMLQRGYANTLAFLKEPRDQTNSQDASLPPGVNSWAELLELNDALLVRDVNALDAIDTQTTRPDYSWEPNPPARFDDGLILEDVPGDTLDCLTNSVFRAFGYTREAMLSASHALRDRFMQLGLINEDQMFDHSRGWEAIQLLRDNGFIDGREVIVRHYYTADQQTGDAYLTEYQYAPAAQGYENWTSARLFFGQRLEHYQPILQPGTEIYPEDPIVPYVSPFEALQQAKDGNDPLIESSTSHQRRETLSHVPELRNDNDDLQNEDVALNRALNAGRKKNETKGDPYQVQVTSLEDVVNAPPLVFESDQPTQRKKRSNESSAQISNQRRNWIRDKKTDLVAQLDALKTKQEKQAFIDENTGKRSKVSSTKISNQRSSWVRDKKIDLVSQLDKFETVEEKEDFIDQHVNRKSKKSSAKISVQRRNWKRLNKEDLVSQLDKFETVEEKEDFIDQHVNRRSKKSSAQISNQRRNWIRDKKTDLVAQLDKFETIEDKEAFIDQHVKRQSRKGTQANKTSEIPKPAHPPANAGREDSSESDESTTEE